MIANEDSMDIAEMLDVEMREGEQHATRQPMRGLGWELTLCPIGAHY